MAEDSSGKNRITVAHQNLLYFSIVRKASCLQFREHQDVVLFDLEGPTIRRNEGERGNRALVLLYELLRQTGGSGLIVSNGAVGDLELQRQAPAEEKAEPGV
ncbi:MAG: hypothetical protein ACI9EF_002905 [Pseudohongiellaceae bacterium]